MRKPFLSCTYAAKFIHFASIQWAECFVLASPAVHGSRNMKNPIIPPIWKHHITEGKSLRMIQISLTEDHLLSLWRGKKHKTWANFLRSMKMQKKLGVKKKKIYNVSSKKKEGETPNTLCTR